MLKNISKREKLLAVTTIGIALIAFVYNIIIEPLANYWKYLDNEMKEKEMVLAKHTRILRDKDNIKKLNDEYSKYYRLSKLTKEEESADALGSIERIARAANVQITNIKPMDSKKFDNYEKFTFKVTTESNINDLTKFIYDIQSSEQLLKVERMVLNAKERQPDLIKAILLITKLSL